MRTGQVSPASLSPTISRHLSTMSTLTKPRRRQVSRTSFGTKMPTGLAPA
jgi:hypothetical protein